MTRMGTFPGRNPATAHYGRFLKPFVDAVSTRSAGTPTVSRRSNPDVVSTETRMFVLLKNTRF